MSRRQLFEGPFQGPIDNLLLPEFDPEDIVRFFAQSQTRGETAEAAQRWAESVRTGEAEGAGHRVDTDWNRGPQAPDTPDEPAEDVAPDETFELAEGAGARPDHANGGNPKDTAEGDVTAGPQHGKSNGRNKTKDTTEPDTSTTEPAPEPAPERAPEPQPEPAPEENTGTDDPDSYVSGLDTPHGYNIEITFEGAWTDALKKGVYAAAEMISDIVIGDLPSHNGVDDLHLTASLTDLNGYWGWGGYTSVRPDSYLPSEGYFRLDADGAQQAINYGIYEDLVMHEMLHTLGFGTAWNRMGLVEDHDGDLRFTGENATEAYNSYYADIAAADALSDIGVPVETDGGSGTAGVHWDDDSFNNEIMTGQLNRSNTVSDMTVAALEDMGYETIYPDGFVFA